MENWLSHLSVLDLSTSIAGPFCAKLLCLLGAEVIKVEPPGQGDPARDQSPFFQDRPHREGSGLFLYLNTGKKSITLDVSTGAGARLLKELAKTADVLIESYEPGVMAELGLSHDGLAATNPGLVTTSITSFGQNGPYRDFKANELIQFALSGLMHPTGFPDREPIQSGGHLPQYKAGLTGAIGVLAALQWRDMTGEGQHLDVSVHEVSANFLETTATLYSYQGIVRGRTGSTLTPPTPMCDMYECLNGNIIVTVLSQQQVASMFEMMERPDFVGNPDYADFRTLNDERKKVVWDVMGGWFREHTADEAFDLCQVWRIPSAKVMSARDLLLDPHLIERQFFQAVEHPVVGPFKYPGAGFKASDGPARPQPSPLLGQHNEEIYGRAVGLSRFDMERLAAMGVI